METPRLTPHVWLIEHEREDPLVLKQREYAREDAAEALLHILRQHVANGLHVAPPFTELDIGRRYDVQDANGWYATYWLSEEQLAADEGMLTAVVTPGSNQRAHSTRPLKQH